MRSETATTVSGFASASSPARPQGAVVRLRQILRDWNVRPRCHRSRCDRQITRTRCTVRVARRGLASASGDARRAGRRIDPSCSRRATLAGKFSSCTATTQFFFVAVSAEGRGALLQFVVLSRPSPIGVDESDGCVQQQRLSRAGALGKTPIVNGAPVDTIHSRHVYGGVRTDRRR